MARATTKDDLLINAKESLERLFILIGSMSKENQELDFKFDISKEKEAHWKRDKNIRDVFIHLYEWHHLFIDWVNSNRSGTPKIFLPEPYNWKSYGLMNEAFIIKNQTASYNEAKLNLQKSHDEVIHLLNQFSNDELFKKGVFSWTGGSTLGQYGVSCTASHYEWAIKKIKKHVKSLA